MIAELHCHTRSSKLPYFPLFYDAVMEVWELLDKCVSLGIEVLAITDHDSMFNSGIAKHIIEEKKLPIILIPACEISSKDGHILAYGISKEIPSGLGVTETIERIHTQGGLAVAAHPFIPVFSLGKKIFREKFDGIEAYNSSAGRLINKKGLEAAEYLGLPAIAGSDAHSVSGLGTGRVVFSRPVKNWQEALKLIVKKEFLIERQDQSSLRIVVDNISTNLKIIFGR